MSNEVKVTITGTDNTKPATDSARRNIAGLNKEAASSSRDLQKASNQAAQAVRSLGGEFGSIKANIGGFSNGLISMTGLIGGVTAGLLGAVVAGNQLAEQANAYNRIKTSFDGLAAGVGAASDSMLAGLQSASRGMISQHDLVLAANRAMLLGVADTEAEMTQLMEVALARGQAMGLSATQAFNDLVTGLGRMSPMILDNLGIVTGGSKVFDDFAASIGKTTDTLTDAEKKQALINLTIESSTQIVEDSKKAQIDATAVLKTAWADFAVVLGEKVAPAYDAVKLAAAGALTAMAGAMDNSMPDWGAELQGIVASLDAVNMSISQLERTRADIGEEAFAGKWGASSPLEEYNKLLAQREELFKQHIDLVTGIAAEGSAKIAAQEAQIALATAGAIQSSFDTQSASARALIDDYARQFERLQDSLTLEVGYTGAARISQKLQDELKENIRLWQMFGYSAERIAGEAAAWFDRQAQAAKTMTGNLRDAEEVARALGTTTGRLLVPMIGELTVQTALFGETLATNIASGAETATSAMLGFGGIASNVLNTLQAGLSGFVADMHANSAAWAARPSKSGGRGLDTQERWLINTRADYDDQQARLAFQMPDHNLDGAFDDLRQASEAAADAIAQIAPSLEGMLAQVPGLFGTSSVTVQDLALGSGYQNKADEYLRRLHDEVTNGVDWEGVDIKDAAAALGMDPNAAAEDILNAFQAAWQNQSLFANPENLSFLDMDAVQAHLQQQLAQAEGEKNLKALFGIGADEDVAAVAALGLEMQSGLSTWLKENGFNDAGASLASALGIGVSENGGELGDGVDKGLNTWVTSDEGAEAIKDFGQRLGDEISKHLHVKPNMDPPDDPASDAGGARNNNRGTGRTGSPSAKGAQTQSGYAATVHVVNNRMDVEQAGRDIARRMRR